MKTKNDGGPAFPIPACLDAEDGKGCRLVIMESSGMTLRQWYAGMALQGMCANADISEAMSEAGMSPAEVRHSFAASALAQADAVLKAEQSNQKEPQ